MRKVLVVLIASALAACGGNNNGNPDGGNPGGSSCTITLSGGVSKTLSCTVSAAFDSSKNTSAVGITSPNGASGAPEASYAVKVNGELSQTTYTSANAVDQGGSVYEGGSSAWVASQTSGQGSAQIQLTSVSTTATVSAGKIYAVHGTVTATLVPAGGGGGANVTMSITF